MSAAAPLFAIVSGLIALIGLLGAYSRVLSPMIGFQTFVGGALLGGALTLIVSLVAILLTRGGRDPSGRRKSLMGLGGGMLLLAIVAGSASTGRDAPPINDISTNVGNPPIFVSADKVPAYEGRDMSFPREFVSIVKESYPDLAPISHHLNTNVVFHRAMRAAEFLGWTIVYVDEEEMIFNAYDETDLFHFVDDIAVRVVVSGKRSLLDVRSKSRDGRGDLGANAARIRAFRDKFESYARPAAES